MYALRKLGYVALYLYVALCAEYVGYVKLCRAVAFIIIIVVNLTCEQSFFAAREGYIYYRRKLFYIQRAVYREIEPLCKRHIVLCTYSFEKVSKACFVKVEAECYELIFKDIFYGVKHFVEVEEFTVARRS